MIKLIALLIMCTSMLYAQQADTASTSSTQPDTSIHPNVIPASSTSDSGIAPATATKDSTIPPVVAPTPELKKESKVIVRDKKAKDDSPELIKTYKGDVNQLKSPKKAFFLSFLMPGLGEFYANAGPIRIGIPVSVEVASYISIFVFKGKYNDLTKKYQQHADKYFHPERFLTWYNYVKEADSTAITIPDTIGHVQLFLSEYQRKTNDYYEMIAKYDEFTQGWDGATPDMIANDFDYLKRPVPGAPNPAPYRFYAIDSIGASSDGKTIFDTTWQFYHDPGTNKRPFLHGKSAYQLQNMDLRTDANNMADRIKWGLYAMIINRMVSSVDAILAANSYNRKMTGGSLTFIDKVRFEPTKVGVSDIPTNGVVARYSF